MNVDLGLLSCMKILIEEQSVTRAADRLGVSPSTVSAALVKLREIFQDPLFNRVPHGLVATPRALEVSDQLNHVLHEFREMLDPRSAFEPESCSLTFHLAAIDQLQAILLPRLMSQLRTRAPNISIELTAPASHYMPHSLSSGELDLAIGFLNPPPDGLRFRLLYEDRFVCVASGSHPVSANLDVETFSTLRHFAITLNVGSDYQGLIEETLKSRKISRNVVLTGPNSLTAADIIGTSDLVVIVPMRFAKLQQEQRSLRIIELPFETPAYNVCLYWHERSHGDPAHTWLRERIAELVD